MTATWEATTDSPEETQSVAKALGSACTGGELFLLTGDLGSGKTCFVQGLARGLDVDEYVHSPTFVMVAQYHQGRLPLFHVDLYRVESEGEAVELGLDEYIGGAGVCAVEWADNAPAVFPPAHLEVRLTDLGGDRRRIVLRANDRRHAALVAALRAAPAPGKR
ncbi:MAG: tRNA (adenosine(37)-N6)-threonylcarbamoyltransferase complex ATPase subunit type 1 TsaE [Chloroflexi bacterium]|nr:tRNA (adenosine(37)-N6)-threonylcarbamoyltransferase complex ATPase subunit type 1 TsaE [Chloroflexota bacterium]MCI0770044.1 tRNA (adenosine(37)-N6)-threonylcarbamoyltransferase complex ATPase subunit type 1 TsaE [Chloroflexota bacterium]